MIIPVQFIKDTGFATGLSPKFSAIGTDGTVYINEGIMTEVTAGNYIYDFDTYNPSIYYFYKFDANDEDVINRYQGGNNELDYFKQTSGFAEPGRSGGTVRIDYNNIGKAVKNAIEEDGTIKKEQFNNIFESIEAKINLLQDELNRKLTPDTKAEQEKSRKQQEQIDKLYNKLTEIQNTPKENVKEQLVSYLEGKLEAFKNEVALTTTEKNNELKNIILLVKDMVGPLSIKKEKEFKQLLVKLEEEPEFKDILLELDEDFKELIK